MFVSRLVLLSVLAGLLPLGAELDARDAPDEPAPHEPLKFRGGDFPTLAALPVAGADPQAFNRHGWTPCTSWQG